MPKLKISRIIPMYIHIFFLNVKSFARKLTTLLCPIAANNNCIFKTQAYMPPLIHQQIAIMLHVMQHIVLLLACIDYRNKICVKCNLMGCSTAMPHQSAWQHLYQNANSCSCTLMTGLLQDVFQKLMETLSS